MIGSAIERVFDLAPVLFLGAFAVLGLLISAILAAARGADARSAVKRMMEALLLTFLGGLVSRTFVSLLLAADRDSPESGLVVGWVFFLWPGIIDTIPYLLGKSLLTTPERLLWIATGLGAFVGMMDGIWRIHDWKGLGWLSFPLDLTWGLAGNTTGALLHLFNCVWAGHGSETRTGAHRYASGFAIKPGFAFTQGSVMSSLARGPGDPLYSHERTHVWQNRIFGPFFPLSYLAWMVVWFLPGMLAGAIVRAGPFHGIEKWCYFNNPWEAWCYAVQGQPRAAFGRTPEEQRLIWPAIFVVLWSVPFFGALVAASVLILAAVW